MTQMVPVLDVADLSVRFPASRNWIGRPTSFVHAVNGVDLIVQPGKSVGIVGESGCGKSTLAQAIIGLVDYNHGTVAIDGQSFHDAQGKAKRDIRQKMQIVFQDPQSSLDRRLPVWRLISEPLHIRGGHSKAELRAKAAQLATAVGLRPEHLDRLPHEFSGGQRQRIAIARAISTDPDLLVLDEPTSALDVSVQAQIINLLLKLQRELGLSYLLISHDVGLVRHFCDDVAVMYLGQIVEAGAASDVLNDPKHPYTQTLLAAAPSLENPLPQLSEVRIGELPNNRILPSGCYYRERCGQVDSSCVTPQVLHELSSRKSSGSPVSQVRCHRVAQTPNL